jgi:hypothetical protein
MLFEIDITIAFSGGQFREFAFSVNIQVAQCEHTFYVIYTYLWSIFASYPNLGKNVNIHLVL